MTRSSWWRLPWLTLSVMYLSVAAGLACGQGERARSGSPTGGSPASASESGAASETRAAADSAKAGGIAGRSSGADSAAERSPVETMPESKSGIEGRIVIGPTCPVVEPDRPCPDRPYRAELTVRDAETGDVVGVVAGDAEGHFRIHLPPGSYVVDPGVPRLVTEPRAEPVTVEVRAGGYVQVVVRFDSGVR